MSERKNETQTIDKKRRAMFGRVGLLALGLYAAPALMQLSEAKASSGGSGGGSSGRGRTHRRGRGRTHGRRYDSSSSEYRGDDGRTYYRTRRGGYRTDGGSRLPSLAPPAN